MTSSIMHAAGIALALVLAASPVLANTITFEGIAPDGGLRNISPTDPLQRDGYLFSDVLGEAAVFSPTSGYNMIGDPTAVLGFAASETITLTALGAGPFDLVRLLMGPSNIGSLMTDVTITGYLDGTGMTETKTFMGLTTATLETLDWTDLSSVTFAATTDTSLDDIIVRPSQSDVAEPASMALLCAGLIGLTMVRRKT